MTNEIFLIVLALGGFSIVFMAATVLFAAETIKSKKPESTVDWGNPIDWHTPEY